MDQDTIFDRLAALMRDNAVGLQCTTDPQGGLQLDTLHRMANGKPLFFGAVRRTTRFVSYHLMPVYVHPPLLDGISPALRKRMQGKSCFNFTTVDEPLFRELARLTQAGYAYYREQGYIPEHQVT